MYNPQLRLQCIIDQFLSGYVKNPLTLAAINLLEIKVTIFSSVFPGDSSELVQPPPATLRSGPGAGVGRWTRGNIARPWRPPDMGHQWRLPAPREDLPRQHRPAVPARRGGVEEMKMDCSWANAQDLM